MIKAKFRAWDKKEKLMCPVEIINFEKGCFLVGNSPTPEVEYDNIIQSSIEEGHFVYFEDLELMQFTGLKDKNKIEIYEGDILETRGKPYHVVEFRKGCFCLVSNEHDVVWAMSFENVYFPHYKVIGNIYQNPELLNTKQ